MLLDALCFPPLEGRNSTLFVPVEEDFLVIGISVTYECIYGYEAVVSYYSIYEFGFIGY